MTSITYWDTPLRSCDCSSHADLRSSRVPHSSSKSVRAVTIEPTDGLSVERNFDVFGFALDDAELHQIDGLSGDCAVTHSDAVAFRDRPLRLLLIAALVALRRGGS